MQDVVTNCEIKFDRVFSKAMDDYLSDSEELAFMDLVNLSSQFEFNTCRIVQKSL